ncbi:nucleic acid binding protein [Nannochloropsis oceanica]
MQSLEELQAALATYKTQTDQVQSLLDLDPSNEAYLTLKSDLQAAIKLTHDLIRTQEDAAAAAAAAAITSATATATATAATAQTTAARATPAAAAVMEMQLRKGGEAGWVPAVGERVDAPWGTGEKRFPAVVVAVEKGGEIVTLKYYGYAETEVKPTSDVRLLTPPGGSATLPPGVATVGWKGEAVWVGDGQWYEAQVLGLVEHGYRIKFVKYGNEGEVPLEFLREKSSSSSGAYAGGGEAGNEGVPKRGREAKEVKEFVIPDALRLLPTDSEEEKARKRRKVKHLKGLWKQRTRGGGGGEDEVEETRSWQAYLAKSKRPKLGMGALKKGSIFKSPEAVDGKVGVMGSGAGMTDFAKRAFKPGKGGGAGGGSNR